MTVNEKLRLFGMILRGRSDDEMEELGYCYRERSEMRAHLVMHGYLDEINGSHSRDTSPFEAQVNRYQMTPSGEVFLEQISRRAIGR